MSEQLSRDIPLPTLVARWAVFLDAIGWEWEAYPEPVKVNAGDSFQPDFLIQRNIYVKVMQDIPTVEQCRRFNRALQHLHRGGEKYYRQHYIFCGNPSTPKVSIGVSTSGFSVEDGYAIIMLAGLEYEEKPVTRIYCFAHTDGGRDIKIWPMYFPNEDGFFPVPVVLTPKDQQDGGKVYGASLESGFGIHLYNGRGVKYKTPSLLAAYRAAKSWTPSAV